MRNKQSISFGAEKTQCVDVVSTDRKVPVVCHVVATPCRILVFHFVVVAISCLFLYMSSPSKTLVGLDGTGINKELWVWLPKRLLVTRFPLYIRNYDTATKTFCLLLRRFRPRTRRLLTSVFLASETLLFNSRVY